MVGHTAGALRVQPHPVAHTSHPTCGYAIQAGDRVVVWAPEFWQFPTWAAGADLMFAEAAAWDRPAGSEDRHHRARRCVRGGG